MFLDAVSSRRIGTVPRCLLFCFCCFSRLYIIIGHKAAFVSMLTVYQCLTFEAGKFEVFFFSLNHCCNTFGSIAKAMCHDWLKPLLATTKGGKSNHNNHLRRSIDTKV